MCLWCVEDCTRSMITNPDISAVISGVMTQIQERSSHSVSVIRLTIVVKKYCYSNHITPRQMLSDAFKWFTRPVCSIIGRWGWFIWHKKLWLVIAISKGYRLLLIFWVGFPRDDSIIGIIILAIFQLLFINLIYMKLMRTISVPRSKNELWIMWS